MKLAVNIVMVLLGLAMMTFGVWCVYERYLKPKPTLTSCTEVVEINQQIRDIEDRLARVNVWQAEILGQEARHRHHVYYRSEDRP